ncbi:MAG: VCBS domain-containing protein [Bradyrhizobium sp.]|uniref:Npun_F0296 family exosortase-dependent surface protein n=1 Tax=Bradyrhizobium sp. TaxID=376 RepID=UPI001C29148E|nr:VCBS domain-containing protein [Bradyrhizobium sp.]MBU6462110.1 VCBS domain-containing protein [Pseudomonadota bacterium]MDE2066841.1 VCBS domain-containing protein [Bradyrhizobium sp.]
MNFVGKFDAQLPADGLAGQAHVQTYSPTAHAPADAIIVPDAHLLFGADFKRSGVDLILSNADRELVVHDYFKGEHRHPLASPDGAHLTGDIVNALTGQVEYAQAAAPDAAAHVIGHVTKLSGSATAIRNGVSVILNNGDNVEKGDVVATGSDSMLGVTFIDGSVFGLSSNARMVLNEMVYDPNGSNNSSLISLVAGTISFVAGETAKHGDMKVDTPVATMGIRGTAVLVEIDFNVPGQNGLPDAKFQVLVEPDGHTGSYILFDKTTLDPIATVNKAGQQVNINQNGISYTNSPLSPELQKLISDVFSQKFTDLNNPNTKTFDHFTDSIVPQMLQPIKGSDGIIATPVVLVVTPQGSGTPPPSAPTNSPQHIDQPPTVVATPGLFGELKDITGSHTPDIASGTINFVDIDAGDQPTASTKFDSVVYQNAQHQDISKSLTPTELAAVQAVEVALNVVQDPADKNNGSATWTYTVPDGALDFLGAGETLTLTYLASVSNNYAPNIEITTVPITITITGTNDVPVITSAVPQTIAFYSGTSVPGGDLTTKVATSGTISFDDPDLTDIHTVSVSTPTSTLTNPTTGKTIAFTLPPTPQALFDQALTASLIDPTTGLSTDSTGTGLGTISWNLADLPVWLGDYIPKGDTLTLTYVVTVTDSQGATAQQDITVTITGTDAPAEVWVATTGTGPAPDGLWSTGANWETGNAPTASDDAIIITDQLEGLTPTYPVTIASAAEAHSLKMDNYGGAAPVLINQSTLAIGTDFNINDHSTDNPDGYTGPELDNQGTLTVGGAFNLNADSIVDNSGTITVEGKMEVLDQSAVENSGTIKLAGGGDFSDESTISNTTADAIIEISGATLNVGIDISNQGTVKVDSAATLTLGSATIDGGTVTVTKNGTLTLNGGAVVKNGTLGNAGQINASGTGNALDNEQITNTGGVEIVALGALTLDLLTTVANTNHTITVDSTGTLTLQGGASVTGGSLSNSGTLDIEGTGATLDGVAVTGSGAVNVDDAATLTTLVLENTTSIANGTLTVGPTGILSVAGDVTLDHVGVTNRNSIEITASNALTLDDTTTLDNTAGTVTIDGNGKLTLNDAEITGGTITDNGTIDVTGSSTIDGNAALNGGHVTIEANQTLTLDDVAVTGTSFDDTASGATIQLDDGATLTLSGATIDGGAITDNGTIDVTGSSTIDGNAALNGGHVTIEANQTLTLDNVTVTGTAFDDTASGATIQVDGATGDTLKLSGVSVTGGGFNVAAHGLVQTSGDVTLANTSVTNDGTIEVTGGQLTITGTGSVADSVANDGGTIQIDGGAVLDLNVSDTQNVSFTGTDGKLQIDTGSFGGSIVGLAATDQIDLTTIGYGPGTTATYVSNAGNTGGTLTVTDGSHSIALQLIGDYTNAHFAGSDDGNHDLLITLNANDDAPVFASGETAQTATVAELTDVTGSPAVDDSTPAGGAIHFTDIDLTDRPTATVTLQTVTWTGGTLTDAETSALESGFQLTPVTNTNNGEIDWTYAITDGSLDFLGAGETATVTSTVTLDDHQGGQDIATVTVTIDGSNDAPVLAADTSGTNGTGLHAITERAGETGDATDIDSASGALSFTDVDLTDTHTATQSDPSYVWSGGSLTAAQITALTDASTLALTETDSTHSGAGSIGFTYSAADNTFDFLAAGETLTVTYNVTITDNNGASSSQPVSFTITGANDAPTITATDNINSNSSFSPLAVVSNADGSQNNITSASHGNDILYVWNDSSGDGVDVRVFNSDGQAETPVTSAAATSPSNASILEAPLAGGGYVILAFPGEGRIVDASGVVQHSFSVDDSAGYGSLVPLTGGGFVVTYSQSGDSGLVFSAFDSAGNLLNTFSAVGSYAEFNIHDATALADGGFLFVWKDSSGNLVAETFNADGTARDSQPFQIDAGTGEVRWYDDVDMAQLPNGDVLATWSQADGSGHVIYGRILDSSGHVIPGTAGSPFEISQTTGNLFAPHISIATDGKVLVDWYDGSYAVSWGAPSDAKIEYRVLDVSGNPIGDQTQLTTQTPGPRDAKTVSLADGSVVFAWSGYDSSGEGVHFAIVGPNGNITQGDTLVDYGHQDGNQILGNLVATANGSVWATIDDNGVAVTSVQLIGTSTNATSASLAEAPNVTGSTATDTATGTITFTDVDITDRPTVQVSYSSFDYQDAAGHDLTHALTAPEQAAVTALESALTLAANSGNANNGSYGWTYSVADSALDFMAAGDTLVLTYDATVTDHNGGTATTPITVTITGSNDAPTIAGETNPATQTVILGPTVLSAGTTTNALGLPTETFDEKGIETGYASNNGAGFGDFTSTALGATFSGSGHAGVVNGSSSASAAPFMGGPDATNYLSIGAGGSETITFATEQNQFGLYWGSADSYNTISFYDGSQLVATYSGADVAPLLANGGQGSFSSNGYVEFSDLAPFTTVVLTSSSNAFEIDNISAGDSHVHLAGPITGTLTVNDADIGDTLTASVAGNAVAEYNGSTTLPSGVDVSALIASGAITFGTVKTTGGQDVLDWTYNPANANLDFLQPGDTLTLTFNATVSDGHATTANQALTITLVGNGASVVNGTAQNDTFTDVGGGVTISGNGGHDVYNFNAHFGSATISDFDVGNDVIDISSMSFASVTALLNSTVASGANGANTLIADSTGDTITLDNVSVAQLKAHPGDFQFTIADGGTFEAGGSTSENVVFEGSTGKLTIDTPSSFSGVISGFTGDGTPAGSDQIDLKGIDHNSSSFTESFNAANDSLFVSDGAHSTTLYFNGVYQAQNFSFTTDNNGGTIVYDPPVAPSTTPDPGTVTQAVAATSHSFVFNFADNAHDTNGAYLNADTHRLDGQTFVNADPDKPHDDGHGQMAPVPDSMDAGTSAVVKALLHAHDFHFV